MLNLKNQWIFIVILAISSQYNFGSSRTLSRVSEALKTTKYPRTTPIIQQPYYAQPTYQPTTWTDWYRSKKYGYEQRATPQETKYERKNYAKAAALAAGGGGLLELLRIKEEESKEGKRIDNFLADLQENPENFDIHNISSFIRHNPELLTKYAKEFFEIMIANKPDILQSLVQAISIQSAFIKFLENPQQMHKALESVYKNNNFNVGFALADVAYLAPDNEKKQLAYTIIQNPEDFVRIALDHKYDIFSNLLNTRNKDEDIANVFALAIAANPEKFQENIREYAGTSSTPIALVRISNLLAASREAVSTYLSSFIEKNLDYLIQDPYGQHIINSLVKNPAIMRYMQQREQVDQEELTRQRAEEERSAYEASLRGKFWKRLGY